VERKGKSTNGIAEINCAGMLHLSFIISVGIFHITYYMKNQPSSKKNFLPQVDPTITH